MAFLATKFLADSDSPHARKLGLLFDEDIDPESRGRSFRAFGRELSLLGVFFAILGEFTNTAPTGGAGKLHFMHDKDAGAGLHGNTPAEKIFCGIANWLGYQLFSRYDAVEAMQQALPALGIPTPVAGLHGNTPAEKIFCGIANWLGYQLFSRYDAVEAMQQALPALGIPTPVWTMIKQYAMQARDIPLPAPRFLERFQQLANQVYEQGYDVRFLAAQSVPVLLNEAITRLFYAVRRLFAYASSTNPGDFSMQAMWEACEPFSNSTVQRMLTVAHGTFCLLDTTDAAIRGAVTGAGTFNVREFMMRLNLVGAGRFAISLYGEGVRAVALQTAGTNPGDFSMQAMWEACEPFSNSTVQRMLTVAHGTFCLLDTTDAAIRGVVTGAGTFNVREFMMRLNLVGAGRFAISLYGEGVRAVALQTAGPNAEFARRERTIVEDYLDGLRELGRAPAHSTCGNS